MIQIDRTVGIDQSAGGLERLGVSCDISDEPFSKIDRNVIAPVHFTISERFYGAVVFIVVRSYTAARANNSLLKIVGGGG